MGEAPDEAEARLMIVRQQGRASVTWSERADRYRWTVVLDEGKTSHGWAESEAEGWWFVKEAVNRPSGERHPEAPRPLDPAAGVGAEPAARRPRCEQRADRSPPPPPPHRCGAGAQHQRMRPTAAHMPRCWSPTVSSGRHSVASTRPGSTSSVPRSIAATSSLVRSVTGLAVER